MAGTGSVMENRLQFEALRKDQETLRFQFISTELDLALTFVDLFARAAQCHRHRPSEEKQRRGAERKC